MRNTLAATLAACASLGLAACAVEPETDPTDLADLVDEDVPDNELIITPGGSDHPGQLVFQLPQELRDASPSTLGSLVIRVGTRDFAYGVAQTMPLGNQTVSYSYQGYAYSSLAPIVADQVTSITLGAVRFAMPPASDRVVGLSSFPTTTGGQQNVGEVFGTSYAPLYPQELLTKVFPRPEGTVRLRWGAFDGMDVPVVHDQVATADLNDLSTRKAIRIVAPPARTLPSCQDNVYTLRSSRTSTGMVETRTQALEPGQSVLLGEASWQTGTITYQLRATGLDTSGLLPLTMPAVGQLTEYRMSRLDIDDVAVDTPGGVQMVRGNYNLLVMNANGSEGPSIASGCATHTGVDVTPGRYRLVVRYNTAEAGTKTTVMTFDVPPGV